ncbi:hypothetical protein ACX40Y_01215 [Sphingomonas sp. RS6]
MMMQNFMEVAMLDIIGGNFLYLALGAMGLFTAALLFVSLTDHSPADDR